MREVEFRGKRKDNGEWIYGYLYRKALPLQCLKSENEIQEQEKCYIIFAGFADWNMPRPMYEVEVIPESVGQYTGQIDDSKDLNDLYDGDIIIGYWNEQIDDYKTEEWSDVALVYWDEDWGQWKVREFETTGEERPLYDCYDRIIRIGNKTDNPELLNNLS